MRGKQRRFAYNEAADNVLQPGKPLYEKIKGQWQKSFFNNDKPLVVELACGRGEYTIGLAKEFPDKNFLGVDIKGDRLWKGSKTAYELELNNVGFLRTFIHALDNFFAIDEIDELWITFPDPRPKDSDERRRLTNNRFLDLYKPLLKEDGWLKFKTDSTSLFDYTLEVLNERQDIKELTFTHDLENSDLLSEHFGIVTHYEKLFSEQGEKIKYLKFKFDKSVPELGS